LLDEGREHFRDPKVFWHAPSARWIMLLVRSAENFACIYQSSNLIDWDYSSKFGPAGADGHLWECPDLFELPIDGSDETRWVLKVDLFTVGGEKRSACLLYFGQFDGKTFLPDLDAEGQPRWHYADAGSDFYAAISWSDIPPDDGRRIWIGWMNCHHYAPETPTGAWRGAMTLPRALGLRRIGDRLRLIQQPVREAEAKMTPVTALCPVNVGAQRIDLRCKQPQDGSVDIDLHWPQGYRLGFGYNAAENAYYIKRSASGSLIGHESFQEYFRAERFVDGSPLTLSAIIDSCTLELFCDDGAQVFSHLFFPPLGTPELTIHAPDDMELKLSRCACKI
ncbi:MAG: glycoside hydrolase family 32 protein, partial [Alphaproteobacteria bacterium]|nr:glycoside hydrolase family 32 protein [Alphaproteobacteria bacterium]